MSVKSDRWDLTLFVLGLLGLLIGMAVALAIVLLAGFALITGETTEALSLLWNAAAIATLGLSGLPAMYWGGRALLGREAATGYRPRRYWIIGLAAFPVAIALGYMAFGLDLFPAIIGPVAHYLAASSPVVVSASVVLASVPGFSIRRLWGHFITGLWLVPPTALAVEVLALIPIALLILVGLSLSPEGLQFLSSLENLQFISPSELEQLVGQALLQPWIIFLALMFITLVVPLVEEALKTIVIWPLLPRGLGPLESFIGGAIGGAGYALFESLFLPKPGGLWIATMFGRSGTSLVHAFATGMTCWGLSQAFRERKPARLILAYAAAVILHGTWNLSALGIGLAASAGEEFFPATLAPALGIGSAMLLIGLSTFSLIALVRISRVLAADAGA
jgi:hypothetical protein